jgi:hypothetical protein
MFERLKKAAASAGEKINKVINPVDSKKIRENRAGISAEVPNLGKVQTVKMQSLSGVKLKEFLVIKRFLRNYKNQNQLLLKKQLY